MTEELIKRLPTPFLTPPPSSSLTKGRILAKETWDKSEEPDTHGKPESAKDKDRMKMVPKSKAQTTAGVGYKKGSVLFY